MTIRRPSWGQRCLPLAAFALCVALGAPLTLSARIPPRRASVAAVPWTHPQTVYRSTVTQHLLRVSVTDRAGRPVGNLGQQDFSLSEDGEPQSIQSFLAPFGSPLEIALISDRSGSMDIGYDKAKEGWK